MADADLQAALAPSEPGNGDGAAAVQQAAEPTSSDASQSAEATNEQESPEPVMVPVTEVEAARAKAQKAAEENAFLRGQLSAVQPGQQEPEEVDESDFFTDPRGYVAEQVQKGISAYAQSQFESRCARTASAARKKYADYDEFESEAFQDAKADPTLATKIVNADNPAEVAYQHVKAKRERAKYGNDEESMREAIREEERAKLLAEMKKEGKPRPPIPPKSQAGASGAGAPAPTGGGGIQDEDLHAALYG